MLNAMEWTKINRIQKWKIIKVRNPLLERAMIDFPDKIQQNMNKQIKVKAFLRLLKEMKMVRGILS